MDTKDTALILIGFQNDSFSREGSLHPIYEGDSTISRLVSDVNSVLSVVVNTDMMVLHAPILFSDDYREMPPRPVGILKMIKEKGAYRRGTFGGETIPEIQKFGDRIHIVSGKTGFSAFGRTNLQNTLNAASITNLVIMGVATAVCIDSTGRAAMENNYSVHFLSNCHAGRNKREHKFYNEEIFPLYSMVMTSDEFLEGLN